MVPIVLLCGNKGVGKSQFADFLVKNHGAVAIAQADPLKRMVWELFPGVFNHDQLYGPSAKREERVKIDASRLRATMAMPVVETWANRLFGAVGKAQTACGRFPYIFSKSIADHAEACGGLTARWVLQVLGTDWARKVWPYVWTNQAWDSAVDVLSDEYAYDPIYGLINTKSGCRPPPFIAITDGRFRSEILSIRSRGGVAVKIELAFGDHRVMDQHASESELRDIPDHFYDEILVNNGDLADLERLACTVAYKIQEGPARTYAQYRR